METKTETITKQDDAELKPDELAEDTDDKITLSEVEEDDEVVEDKPADDVGSTDTPEGFDIVKSEPEGESASKPDLKAEHVDALIAKTRRRGQVKLAEANEANAGVSKELDTVKEENRLLLLALKNQTTETNEPAPLVKPNHEEFLEGRDDKKYLAELETFENDKVERAVAAQVKKLTEGQEKAAPAPQTNGQIDPAIEQRQRAHFERVVDLGVDDYDASEQVVADIFGGEILSRVIDSFDNSDKMVYFLGKESNQAEAKKIAGLLKSGDRGAIRAIAALGKLDENLKRVPRGKPNAAGKQPVEQTANEDMTGIEGATFE